MRSIINTTLKLARNNDIGTSKHAAVIFRKNRILAKGVNRYKTHPLGSGYHNRLHAEIDALLRVLKHHKVDLSKCSIYVARVNNQGEPRMSKPCKDCMRILRKYGLSVFWTKGPL